MLLINVCCFCDYAWLLVKESVVGTKDFFGGFWHTYRCVLGILADSAKIDQNMNERGTMKQVLSPLS